MIEYRDGSLFDAPPGSILVHACNAQGVWGSGIAVEFRKRFYGAYKRYVEDCGQFKPVGMCKVYLDKDYAIGCLFTSRDYGDRRDPPEAIEAATRSALGFLWHWYSLLPEPPSVCSPRFNSGLFGVPWEQTAAIIEDIWPSTWVVYTPQETP